MCTIQVTEQREKTIFGENYHLTQILKEDFVLSGIYNFPGEVRKCYTKEFIKKCTKCNYVKSGIFNL